MSIRTRLTFLERLAHREPVDPLTLLTDEELDARIAQTEAAIQAGYPEWWGDFQARVEQAVAAQREAMKWPENYFQDKTDEAAVVERICSRDTIEVRVLREMCATGDD